MPTTTAGKRRKRAPSRGTRRRPAGQQLALPKTSGWGGKRPGAGRPRRLARAATPHRARPVHRAGEPVHVTLRAAVRGLRSQFLFPSVRLAISAATRRAPERFRIVHFSVQDDHVHLLVEAKNARELSSGMRGLAIRVARCVNDLLRRRGRFWADRWHGRALGSPREVRNAFVYVLANFRKHARRRWGEGLDQYASGAWFDGWREWRVGSLSKARFAARPPPGVVVEPHAVVEDDPLRRTPVSPARTWLATAGWRKRGLIGLSESPRADG
jgi:REP-associated tyrosine transposase